MPDPFPGSRSTETNEIQTFISKTLTSSGTLCDEGPKSYVNEYRARWEEKLVWSNHEERAVSDLNLKNV